MSLPDTDTPRTTALMYPNGALSIEILEHARTLERELFKAEKERDEAKLAFKILGDRYEQLINEIKAKQQ